MHSHGSTLSANYTKVSNDLLNAVGVPFAVKGLLGYLLVRPGWREADIKTLSAKFGESQSNIAKWMRQLAELGYLVRRKVRTPRGTWMTLVAAFDRPQNVPGADMSTTTSEALQQLIPSLGRPSLGRPSVPPSGVKTEEKTPPTPEPLPMSIPGEEMSSDHAASAAILRKIGDQEPRLRMGALEMLPLLPLVASWRERGASEGLIIRSCTEGLPERVWSPVKLLAKRLEMKMPAPLPVRVDQRTVAEVLTRPEPKAGECADCGRPMVRECAHCAGIETGLPESLLRSKNRGIRLARELLGRLS